MTLELSIFEHGTTVWYCDQIVHNKYKHAVECLNSSKMWAVNGKRHRLDGPAIEYENVKKSWYINDVEYTYLEYLVAVEQYKVKHNVE